MTVWRLLCGDSEKRHQHAASGCRLSPERGNQKRLRAATGAASMCQGSGPAVVKIDIESDKEGIITGGTRST